MAVWLTGVLLYVTVSVVAGNCLEGTYGYKCGYQCHCHLDKCNAINGCSHGDCDAGWSGLTCRKGNMAFNKTTSSSSVNVDFGDPGNAVNGDNSADNYKKCFHSDWKGNSITEAWWRVDLGDEMRIQTITIYFRKDYKVRRNGIQIYIADTEYSPTDGVNCYNVSRNKDGTDIPDVLNVTCSSEGRYLVLYTTTVNNEINKVTVPVLDFCEVEVVVCSSGTFGADCDNYCYCEGEVCDYVSGICPSGVCLPGWTTETCDTECKTGHYGANCTKICSTRNCKGDNSSCAHVTGECVAGCTTGWIGADCTQKCETGHYGANCTNICSTRNCKGDDSSCDHLTGECAGGCTAGWKGTDCTQRCETGHYGANCNEICSTRNCMGDNSSCDPVKGKCDAGCTVGWHGTDCRQTNSQSASPGNGAVVGGAVGGVVAVAVAVVVVTVLAVLFYRRKRNANPKRSDNSVYENVSAFEPQEPNLQAGHSVNAGYEEEEEEDAACAADESGKSAAGAYYNIGPVIVTEVEVDKLWDRIRDMQATKQGFEKEYQKLISGFTHTYEDSQLEGNAGKNRFLQYYPYDYNRVVLDKILGDPFSDYINASYINGFSRDQAYIAAQAPNRKTVADFWRMIYQKNLTKIVMLTNLKEMGKVKCEPYWSDTSELEAGPFSITVTKVIYRACWVIRELTATVKETGENKMFCQFHFTKWPDHGTPDETHLMEFLWRVRKTPSPDNSPLLVHCSAGVGRTGTYIALDYLLDMALCDQKVDVFRFTCDMRRQRRNMIQTKEQYACVYTTLYEVLTVGDTFLASLDFAKQRGRKKVFKMGNLTVPRLIQRVKSDIQRDKAGKDIKGRVWVNGSTDILAVMMPSHLSMNGYLLAEAPSVTTASLFWKLTEEQDSSTVIVLPDSHQRVSSFIPAPGESLDLGPVSVTCSTENTINPNIVFRNIQQQMEGDASSQTVRVYMLMMLPTDDHSVLLDLLEQVDLGTRGNTSNSVTVVFGENEKRVATLFCILSNIVLGIRYDNEVEIYNNIRRLGHLHANDLTQEEISLCYDLASTYLETQNLYANM